MSVIYAGSVVLPDGRSVAGRIWAYVNYADDTIDVDKVDLEWKNGDALTADEYDEVLADGVYLHEFVTDALCAGKPEVFDRGD